ncbi:hypothetical protein IWQ61_009128 [Dispira simplex]|nr:hypothetical protein IWQ61_009128 [Dispira simplex]
MVAHASRFLKGRNGLWEVVVGLEIHAQLNTVHKLFSPTSYAYATELPNRQVSVIDAAFPGVQPRLNPQCMYKAVQVIAALGGTVQPLCRFDRKHYFYPDLPQGYQITQRWHPIGKGGTITWSTWDTLTHNQESPAGEVEHSDNSVQGKSNTIQASLDLLNPVGMVRIEQVQLEQDTAKSIHDVVDSATLLDLNRAGVPLVEIVTSPDVRSPREAVMVIRKLQEILQSIGASDARMEEGSMRCDVNVSVRPAPDSPSPRINTVGLGTRVELKNLNSLRLIYNAIQAEAERQIRCLESTSTDEVLKIVPETRGFDPTTSTTFRLRSKEQAPDYRYMPETDIPPLQLSPDFVQAVRARMTELPDARRRRLCKTYGLKLIECHQLMVEPGAVEYFEAVIQLTVSPATNVLSWITSELYGQLKVIDLHFAQNPVRATQLASLINIIQQGLVSGKIGKAILGRMLRGDPRLALAIAEAEGWRQIDDQAFLEELCRAILDANPQQIAQYHQGKQRVFGWLVGQVIKESKGKANPKSVKSILQMYLHRNNI